MDSERPAPPNQQRHLTRPFYLVIAMVLLWMLGVQGLRSGATTAMILRDGSLPDMDAATRAAQQLGDLLAGITHLLDASHLAALGAASQLAFPLGVARALLASTLLIASTLVLLGRPSARNFALQALLANALFAVLEFALLRHVRGAWIDVAARAAIVLQDPTIPEDPVVLTRLLGYWSERVYVFMELAIPTLAALALTRPRTKVYFAEAAAAAEGAEEEP